MAPRQFEHGAGVQRDRSELDDAVLRDLPLLEHVGRRRRDRLHADRQIERHRVEAAPVRVDDDLEEARFDDVGHDVEGVEHVARHRRRVVRDRERRIADDARLEDEFIVRRPLRTLQVDGDGVPSERRVVLERVVAQAPDVHADRDLLDEPVGPLRDLEDELLQATRGQRESFGGKLPVVQFDRREELAKFVFLVAGELLLVPEPMATRLRLQVREGALDVQEAFARRGARIAGDLRRIRGLQERLLHVEGRGAQPVRAGEAAQERGRAGDRGRRERRPGAEREARRRIMRECGQEERPGRNEVGLRPAVRGGPAGAEEDHLGVVRHERLVPVPHAELLVPPDPDLHGVRRGGDRDARLGAARAADRVRCGPIVSRRADGQDPLARGEVHRHVLEIAPVEERGPTEAHVDRVDVDPVVNPRADGGIDPSEDDRRRNPESRVVEDLDDVQVRLRGDSDQRDQLHPGVGSVRQRRAGPEFDGADEETRCGAFHRAAAGGDRGDERSMEVIRRRVEAGERGEVGRPSDAGRAERIGRGGAIATHVHAANHPRRSPVVVLGGEGPVPGVDARVDDPEDRVRAAARRGEDRGRHAGQFGVVEVLRAELRHLLRGEIDRLRIAFDRLHVEQRGRTEAAHRGRGRDVHEVVEEHMLHTGYLRQRREPIRRHVRGERRGIRKAAHDRSSHGADRVDQLRGGVSDRLDEHSHRRLSLKRRGKDFRRQLAQREQVRGIHRDDADGDRSEAPRHHRNRENQGQSLTRSRTSTQLHSSSLPGENRSTSIRFLEATGDR